MELKDIFAICAKLKYPENKLLYEYFDAVTFVDSVDEFLAATFEYLANLDDTNTSQIFRSFLYDNLILHIIQQHKISKPYQPKKLTIIPNAFGAIFLPLRLFSMLKNITTNTNNVPNKKGWLLINSNQRSTKITPFYNKNQHTRELLY